jgi:ribulose-phosphate 3-epimerase
MRNVNLIVLLTCVVQGHSNGSMDMDRMVDMLVSKMFTKGLEASTLTDVDGTTLGKAGLALSPAKGMPSTLMNPSRGLIAGHGTRPAMQQSLAMQSSKPMYRIVASAKLGDFERDLSTPRDVQIIPSVLPADWAAMGQCVKDLEAAGVDRIQFDVMDGNFVPNLTFGPEMIAACRKYCKTPFETQLMVTNYNSDTMLEDYVAATKGPNGEPGVVIVHVEACVHLHRTLAKIRQLGGSPSVALNPHTPMEMVKNVLDMVDHVLVMTVNPGFGGQAYIPTMVNKIAELRKAIVDGGYNVDIEVDGGVKADWTISQCAAAGANCFIAGSGMFAYPTLKEGCDALRKVAKDAQAGNLLDPPKA